MGRLWPVARLTSSSGSPFSKTTATSTFRLLFQRLYFFILTSNCNKISNQRCPINYRGNPEGAAREDVSIFRQPDTGGP